MTSIPSTVMLPRVGGSRLPIIWSRVVLPEPDTPVSPTDSPASTVRETSSITVTGPKHR